jgi:hypothetical protein
MSFDPSSSVISSIPLRSWKSLSLSLSPSWYIFVLHLWKTLDRRQLSAFPSSLSHLFMWSAPRVLHSSTYLSSPHRRESCPWLFDLQPTCTNDQPPKSLQRDQDGRVRGSQSRGAFYPEGNKTWWPHSCESSIWPVALTRLESFFRWIQSVQSWLAQLPKSEACRKDRSLLSFYFI